MPILTVDRDVVRLECEHCGAHRVVDRGVYLRAHELGIGIRCTTCTELTAERPPTPQEREVALAG